MSTLEQETALGEPLLRVDKLKAYYPIRKGIFSRTVGFVKAVDGVSFNLYPGETLGLVGESGCGKSTIGRTIIRLDESFEGNIWFRDKDITHYSSREMKPIRSEMQMIFQDPYSSLNPRKRIGDLLAEPLQVHGIVEPSAVPQEVKRLMELVGFPGSYRDRYPHEFSGGQRQRIGIARALSLRPKLIICDEPVSALDVSIQAQILNLLKDLQKELSLTYLFIGHGLGAVRNISSRIAIMYLGRILEIGDKSDIFNHPRHPYTQALLSAYPVPNPHLRNRERIVLQGEVPSPVNPPSGCRFHTRCPQSRDMCRSQEPKLRGTGHLAACFFQ